METKPQRCFPSKRHGHQCHGLAKDPLIQCPLVSGNSLHGNQPNLPPRCCYQMERTTNKHTSNVSARSPIANTASPDSQSLDEEGTIADIMKPVLLVAIGGTPTGLPAAPRSW